MNKTLNNNSSPFDKSCDRCHESFECRADSVKECHCSKVSLNAEQLTILRERYRDCLCNSCLTHFIETVQYQQY